LPSPGTTSRCNPIAGVPLEPETIKKIKINNRFSRGITHSREWVELLRLRRFHAGSLDGWPRRKPALVYFKTWDLTLGLECSTSVL